MGRDAGQRQTPARGCPGRPGGGPGGLQALPPPLSLTDSASSFLHRCRAVRGRAGARTGRPARASATGLRPGSGSGDRSEPGPQRGVGPEVAPGREQVRALKPARCPLPSPPQPPPPPASPDATPGPATSAVRDAPEAGLGGSRDARGLGADRAADWRAALGGGALRQLADRWRQGLWLATEESGPGRLIGSCEVFDLWEMRPKPTEC